MDVARNRITTFTRDELNFVALKMPNGGETNDHVSMGGSFTRALSPFRLGCNNMSQYGQVSIVKLSHTYLYHLNRV